MTVNVVTLLPCSAKSLEMAKPSPPLFPQPQKTKISFLFGYKLRIKSALAIAALSIKSMEDSALA
jgi:hypothetical protein